VSSSENSNAWRAIAGIYNYAQDIARRGLVPPPDGSSIRGPSVWLGKEGQGYKEYTALLWLVETRVIIEKFHPKQGRDGEGWFRRIADIDWLSGDVYISNKSERGGWERSYNANDPGLDSNDTVYIGQTKEDLAEIIVGSWTFPPAGSKVEELKFE